MEKILINELQDIIGKKYTNLKESYKKIKLELHGINQQINTYNRFLNMVKSPKDFYKKNVMEFYALNIIPILMTSIEEIADTVDERDYPEEIARLNNISNSEIAMFNEKLAFIRIRINQLNKKKDSIGNTNIYSEQISKIKKILKSLNSNEYYENEISYDNIIEYIINSNINSDKKNYFINHIEQDRNQYLKNQEAIKAERELRKMLLEQQRLELKKSNQNNTNNIDNANNNYKFNYEEFLNDNDLELMKQINSSIYQNIEILDNISQEMINLISESLKYNELEIDLDSILSNYKIDNYKNIVILYEVRKLLNEIRKIFDYLRLNNIEDVDKYKKEVSTYMSEIRKQYSEYVVTKSEEVISNTPQTEKHIIYLKNSSNETLLKNDIIKEKENYRFFINILEDLKSGTITNNHEKDVRFTNNGKLSDVCKKKESHARLVYCPCDDCYIVFAGFIKKNSSNNYELNLVKNRYSYYKKQIDKIIKDLSDPIKKQSIINENDELHIELMDYLKNNSRAKTKQLKNDLK